MKAFDPIESPVGPGLTVIEAGAGTGKTFSISHLVPRLLLERENLRTGEILLVTYTNDAAGELADRTRKAFAALVSNGPPANGTVAALRRLMEKTPGGAEKIRQAIRELDLLSVSTIHSFCQSVIQTEGELCGHPVVPEVLVDWRGLVRESVHDAWKSRIATDEALARLAGVLGWKFGDDLDFASAALEMPEVLIEPDPPRFEGFLAGLGKLAGHFHPADLDALEKFLPTVGWNAAGGTAEFRSSVLETLRSPGGLAELHEAASWTAGLDSPGGPVKKTRNGDPHCRAAGLAAVKTAKSVVGHFKMLTLSWRKHLAETVAEKVGASLRGNRLTTFQGMVKTLDDSLRGPRAAALRERLRSRFKAALVDESQDTDGAQFRIFEKIFLGSPDHSLVLIGDPKQAIYAFRGADVNTYLAAKNRPGTEAFTLSETYRSPQPLVDCVNALFGRPRSFHKPGLEFLHSTSGMAGDTWLQETAGGNGPFARLEAWTVPESGAADFSNGEKRLARISGAVASEIARLLGLDGKSAGIADGGSNTIRPVVPADFAVLVSQNHEAAAVHAALRARGIPAIRKTGEDVMASEEAGELFTLLSAVNTPLQAKARRAALATRLLGRTDWEIRGTGSGEEDATAAKFQLWQAEWARRGISWAIALIDSQEGISERLASSPDGERRVTNFRHLANILAGFSAGAGGKPNRLLVWLGQEIARASGPGAPPEERLLQLESDGLAVKITTMHSAKGLEFPLVFCPFLWASKEPNAYQVLNRNGRFLLVDTSICGPAVHAEIGESLLEERLRLAYVASTRAKVKLWVCAGAVPGPKGGASALDWLLRPDRDAGFSEWSAGAASNRGTVHRTSLQEIAGQLGGQFKLVDGFPPEGPWQYHRPPAAITGMAQRASVPQLFWRVTSFSELTREKDPKGDPPHEFGPGGPEPAMEPQTNAFAPIPGGAVLGTAVHAFLEEWDFSEVPGLADLEKHFAPYPLGAAKGGVPAATAAMLADLRAAVLPGIGCTVAGACGSPKASEWQFHLPAKPGFGILEIASAFRTAGNDPEYAGMLEALGPDALEGFLQGFIDKVAVHGSAFGVVDWKTNKLPAYNAEQLRAAARASHYWLQAHLYLVALGRHLGPRADIRGAWLVYLRGVEAGSPKGIVHIQPPPGLLAELDNLFAKPAP